MLPLSWWLVSCVIVSLTTSVMILLVHWCWSLLLPFQLVGLVFLCISLFGVRVLQPSLPLAFHVCSYFCWLSHLISFWASHWAPNLCHASFNNHTSWLDFSLSFCNFHFKVYHVMCGCLLENQDHNTGSPDSIFADLFGMFVVDSSAKYIKE